MRYQHFTAEILQFLKKNCGLESQDIVMIRFEEDDDDGFMFEDIFRYKEPLETS